MKTSYPNGSPLAAVPTREGTALAFSSLLSRAATRLMPHGCYATPAPTRGNASRGLKMMKTTKTNPLWLYLLMALALTGCQSMREGATARDKYADAERALIVAIDTATAAFKAGELKGEPLKIVKAALTEAAAALDQMNVRVKSGNTLEADYWLTRVQAALNVAQAYINTRGA